MRSWCRVVSRTLQQSNTILRGFEFCAFDSVSMLIREIRGYYAAAPHQDVARHELVGFDYAGTGTEPCNSARSVDPRASLVRIEIFIGPQALPNRCQDLNRDR